MEISQDSLLNICAYIMLNSFVKTHKEQSTSAQQQQDRSADDSLYIKKDSWSSSLNPDSTHFSVWVWRQSEKSLHSHVLILFYYYINRNAVQRATFQRLYLLQTLKNVCIFAISDNSMLNMELKGRRKRRWPQRRLIDVVRRRTYWVGVKEDDARDRVKWTEQSKVEEILRIIQCFLLLCKTLHMKRGSWVNWVELWAEYKTIPLFLLYLSILD